MTLIFGLHRERRREGEREERERERERESSSSLGLLDLAFPHHTGSLSVSSMIKSTLLFSVTYLRSK